MTMAGQPPIPNAGDVLVVHTRRAPSRMSPPTRISRSPGFLVSQTALPDDQTPSTRVRRAVAVELTPAPPGTLDGYVKIEGSDVVLKVLRKAQGESGLRFQVRFGDGHTEVVSTRDLAVNASQDGKVLVSFKSRVVSHSLRGQGVNQITKSYASSKYPSLIYYFRHSKPFIPHHLLINSALPPCPTISNLRNTSTHTVLTLSFHIGLLPSPPWPQERP